MARVLHTAAELDLAGLLVSGPLTATELAARSGCAERPLGRLLRLLASEGVFDCSDGRYALNGASRQLLGDGRVQIIGWAGLDEAYRAFGHLTEAVRTGTPAFRLCFGDSFYGYHASHPERAQPYIAAVESMTADVADLTGMLRPDRFGRFVDVGGEHGALLGALLEAFPSASGVLLDLPGTVAGARFSERVAGRLEVVGGDFFESVPEGGDAYLLATVLRTLDDGDCRRVLGRCRAAMTEAARLLIVEQVLEEGVPPPPGPMRDIVAFALYGGRERTRAEFADLLAASGFRLDSVVPGPGFWSCVEAVPV